ncbi:FtsH protease activity modulator HflK [Dokdonella sp.]|uniref:FtsH protease activity modulator HflK n=1 Tax=Dokdonella sp. TaxID=2291710 RepID=UPI0025B9053F|nr:FtsH protease activity modulator HflK [Dokdonella sp.]MBX3693499.1 FtsH protease activity modulator HflK [Dokdonella sp.]
MAWNEPGGGKQRDPWRDNDNGGPKNDVDAAVQRLKEMFGRLFGGGGGSRGGSSGEGGFGGVALAAVGIAIAWVAFDSVQSIKANEAGVVLRFGQITRVMPSGLNFKWPRPIETVHVVDATSVRSASDSVRMLTRDENIVQVNFEVQYLVADPVKFLFSTRDPDATLKQAAESAVREVIGAGKLDAIMPDQRVEPAEGEAAAAPAADLAAQARQVIQSTLDRYDAGLTVSTLNFQNVRPPQEVKEAFDDAISAREDRQRASNIADAYAKRVVPEARGEAARILAEAEGYKAERIAKAEGDAQRFGLIVAEYRAAPEVTRKRLYLETMQQVVNRNAKVVDMTDGKNVLYLPAPGATTPPAPPQVVVPEAAPSTRAESARGGR